MPPRTGGTAFKIENWNQKIREYSSTHLLCYLLSMQELGKIKLPNSSGGIFTILLSIKLKEWKPNTKFLVNKIVAIPTTTLLKPDLAQLLHTCHPITFGTIFTFLRHLRRAQTGNLNDIGPYDTVGSRARGLS